MKSPAFQFYVRDWILSRSVGKMSGDEVKAYIYLLCESWLESPRASLPNDDDELSRMAQVNAEKWQKIKAKVMANFELRDNLWVNLKLAGVSDNQEKFRSWGKMGGNPNLGKNKQFEPRKVKAKVNPIVNGTHNPIVNLATATSSATDIKKEEVAIAPVLTGKRKFTDLWISEYRKAFNVPYKFAGARDGQGADSLLALGMSPEEIMGIARAAWSRQTLFWCKQAVTLAGFSSKFNEIRAEIGGLKSASIYPMKSTGCFSEDSQ